MAMICRNGSRECTGCMECQPDAPTPVCLVCGAQPETYYYDDDDNIVGCSECIHEKDAWEVA